MRLMNWNIEHMNSWWESGNAEPAVMRASFVGNNFSPPITDVRALAERVGNVINAVDPDVMTIQEGPGLQELRDFFDRFVDGTWDVRRGDGGAQALCAAARSGRGVSFDVGPEAMGAVDLNQPFKADVQADLQIEELDFARKPQVLNLNARGRQLLLVNNHLKCKFVAGAEQRFHAGGEQRISFFADALVARRRISAEAFRIRAYLDAAFAADPAALIIVTGDLNDGPGADFFEETFLTHSVVDRVFGSMFYPERQLIHVLLHGGSMDFTAQFFDFIAGEVKELVLDHVGISPAMVAVFRWQGRVAVSEYEAQRVDDPGLAGRDRVPSDHRPVVLDLTPI